MDYSHRVLPDEHSQERKEQFKASMTLYFVAELSDLFPWDLITNKIFWL